MGALEGKNVFNLSRHAQIIAADDLTWPSVGVMAIRQIIESDLSGAPRANTFRYVLGNKWYEIDITKDELEELEAVMKKYVEHSREISPMARNSVPAATPEDRNKIRAWAKDNGFDIADRGRITNEVLKAYDASHGTSYSSTPRT